MVFDKRRKSNKFRNKMQLKAGFTSAKFYIKYFGLQHLLAHRHDKKNEQAGQIHNV
jgi:hypothetical protein